MSESELAARLTAHEHAFEGLLDLIPAKFYNPEDAANQWNKRKQTKEEAVQAKRAKLDPDQTSRRKISINGTEKVEAKPIATKKRKNKPSEPQKVKKGAQTGKVPNTQGKITQTEKPTTMNGDADAATDAGEEHVETSAILATQADSSRNITDLRARLAAKIEALRTKRKAPGSGVDGAPRSREAILEARRKKEDARREKKRLDKEARKDAAQEVPPSDQDLHETDEEESDDEEEEENGISYGKVAFSDGQRVEGETLKDSKRRKQQDVKSALQAALNKKARLAALPSEKQHAIAESDSWHKALLAADGERLKDDVGLLKKAAKRQEATKKKSTKEWKERLATIAKAKALKQKNREQNLKDRRESKGKSGGHKKGKQIGAYQGKKSKSKSGKGAGF